MPSSSPHPSAVVPAAPSPERAAAPGGRRRLAAIDGLRGLALLGMLAWHAHVGWVRGGFARMTIFFVLSGFLAASSYQSLRGSGHAHPFRAFWARRARRLLPVTVLGVGFAIAVTVAVGSDQAVRGLRGDALAVLGNVVNWRFIVNEQSYGALFERPSAFQHFWSLSLEEQCFWLLPLVLAGVAVTGRRAWIVVAVVAAALGAVPLLVTHSPDAAYYGTHVRGGEFLVGVALALALARTGGRVPDGARPAVRVVGAASLVGLVVVMVAVDRSLPWLYRGGLGLFAVPAVLVVAAALDERGLVPRVLSIAPLVALGRWAFPIYVLHWPVFLVLSAERTGWSGPPLVVLQLGVSIALGALVHVAFERPLLDRSAAGWRRDAVVLPLVGGAAVALALVALAVRPPAATYDFAALETAANTGPVEGMDSVAVDDGRPSLAMFGGSTAVSLGGVAWDWASEAPAFRPVPGDSKLGCGLLAGGVRVFGRQPDGSPEYAAPDEHCLGWEERWPQTVSANGIDVAILMTGVWDTADWRFEGEDVWRSIGDPQFDARVETALVRAVDSLSSAGARVVLTTTPLVGPGRTGTARAERSLGADHQQRVTAYNDILRRVADARGQVVVDYGAFVDGLAPEQSAAWLPDGIHPTRATALEIWRSYLGPAVEQATGVGRPIEAW